MSLETAIINVQKKAQILQILSQVKNAPTTIANIQKSVAANTPKLKEFIASSEAAAVLGNDFADIKVEIDAL